MVTTCRALLLSKPLWAHHTATYSLSSPLSIAKKADTRSERVTLESESVEGTELQPHVNFLRVSSANRSNVPPKTPERAEATVSGVLLPRSPSRPPVLAPSSKYSEVSLWMENWLRRFESLAVLGRKAGVLDNYHTTSMSLDAGLVRCSALPGSVSQSRQSFVVPLAKATPEWLPK